MKIRIIACTIEGDLSHMKGLVEDIFETLAGEAGHSPRLTPKRGRPLAKDRDKTLTATKPWVAEDMSESTWRRRRAEQRERSK